MKNINPELIKEIASELELGLCCYVHRTTGELISLPDTDDDIYLEEDEKWAADKEKVENDPDNYIEIRKPGSRASFSIMSDFVDQLTDNSAIKVKLIRALDGSKPFRAFMFEIDNGGHHREEWFKFKTNWMQEWVKEEWEAELE